MQIISLIILGTSTALGQPLLLGSFTVTVLKKDSHTRDETLLELYVLCDESLYNSIHVEIF